MKQHIITKYLPGQQPAYVSNGFLGIRVRDNPLRDQTALLNGFSLMQEQHAVEALAPVPAPRFDLVVDGNSLTGRIDLYDMKRQVYDFTTGELTTDFTFTPTSGRVVKGRHTLFPSRDDPTLLLQNLQLTSDADMDIRVDAALSIQGLPLEQVLRLTPRVDADGVFLLKGRGGLDRAGVAFSCQWDEGHAPGPAGETWGYENERIDCLYSLSLKKGVPATLTMMTAYVPGSLHSEPHWQAVRMIKLAAWKGYERIRQNHLKRWEELWAHRVVIGGAGKSVQDIVDAAMFYLYSSMHPSAIYSLAPFGLSDRDKYKGHVFWDTESFMFLLPLMTNPPIARAMLDYRFERLQAARNNAKINGYLGAQFPWQSLGTGDEVTRVSAGQAGGAGEQHVNMDVALAFAAYACINPTDDVFLKEKAWPVLREVADWIASRVTKTNRGYETLYVTGISEEHDNVSNDAYTNLLCRKVLDFANQTAIKLGYKEKQDWRDIADHLVLPVRGGLLMESDEASLADHTMAPLMAYFSHGCSVDEEVDQTTLKHYVAACDEDQLSYPMLSGFLSVFPAMLGDRAKALDFFMKGNADFLTQPYLMPVEFSTKSERFRLSPELAKTTFLTGRGSMMAALLLGFTRFDLWQDSPENRLQGPITLPEGWDSITLHRVYLDGRPARVVARQGAQKAEVRFLDE